MSAQKSRTRVACQLCNLRRVKCDRTANGACSNCRLAGATCELINSRRGRYPRASRRSGVERTPNIPSSVDPPSHVANDSAILSPDTTERDTRATRRYVSPSLSEIAVHQDGANAPGRVVYMGDSANFKYVVHEVGNPFRSSDRYRFWGDNLQRSMLDRLGPPTQVAIQNFRAQDDEQLRRVRAFDTPTKDVGDSLIRSFWTYSYPVFPVFHWEDFMAKYNSGSLSPLLLNAVYMVASFHCPESVIHDAGLSCRYLAGLTFYRRAKALYDADYESDGITTIQATVLLSNWWGGPMELKDTWYWLGVAVGLAQSLGMHRSKSYSIVPLSTQKVWRRLWWVLYINDIHHAAIYGRPPHTVYPCFCDVPRLQNEDFEGCFSADSEFMGAGTSLESKLFLISHADLISRVGDCLSAKLASVEGNPTANNAAYNNFLEWETQLPVQLQNIPAKMSLETGFWPALIHIIYCDYQIVLYRMLSDKPVAVGLGSPQFEAAAKISRLLEDLLASGTLYNAPSVILPAIFASVLICIMNIRKGIPDIRIISEHRLRLNMQILHKFQDTWPIAIWTRHLLDGLLKISTEQSFTGDDSRDVSTTDDPCHIRDSHHGVYEGVPDLAGVDGMAIVSPPTSISDGNIFSSDGLNESHLAGFPASFPFQNLFEEVGLNSESIWY